MNGLKAALIRLLLQLCAALPLSAARALGRGLSRLYWLCNGASRRVTERNIGLAFPSLSASERRALAQRSLAATAELVAEMGRVWLRPWSKTRCLIESVEGAGLIAAARAGGRGVLVLAPHAGNWEVLGLHLATLAPTVSLYEPPQLAGLDALVRSARERSGATLVPTDSRGLARLLRSVKAGDVAGILPDQVPRSLVAGENVPFMGVRCFTPTLACQLLRRSGALAVFGMARRTARGFRIHYLAAEDGIYAADISTALAAMNRGIEACVRLCPEQYQWEYKRFKLRPKEGPGVYDDL